MGNSTRSTTKKKLTTDADQQKDEEKEMEGNTSSGSISGTDNAYIFRKPVLAAGTGFVHTVSLTLFCPRATSSIVVRNGMAGGLAGLGFYTGVQYWFLEEDARSPICGMYAAGCGALLAMGLPALASKLRHVHGTKKSDVVEEGGKTWLCRRTNDAGFGLFPSFSLGVYFEAKDSSVNDETVAAKRADEKPKHNP